MPREKHEVALGDKFKAGVDGVEYILEAVGIGEERKLAFQIVEPEDFTPKADCVPTIVEGMPVWRSVSAAATGIVGMKQINGWNFWSPAGSAPKAKRAKAKKEQPVEPSTSESEEEAEELVLV